MAIRLVAVTALALGGCSWLFLETAPKSARASSAVACDDDLRLPTIDAGLAVAGYAGFIGGLIGLLVIDRKQHEVATLVMFGGTMTAIIGGVTLSFSSRYGEREVQRCARLKGVQTE